jgi:hypothetical protein
MLLFWRGLGWSVLPILFGWIFLLIFVMIATQGPAADPNAAANTSRLFGLAFALSTASVFYLARRRANRPRLIADPATGESLPVPQQDDFMFIPMKYWSYIFAAGAAYFFIRSFFE